MKHSLRLPSNRHPTLRPISTLPSQCAPNATMYCEPRGPVEIPIVSITASLNLKRQVPATAKKGERLHEVIAFSIRGPAH